MYMQWGATRIVFSIHHSTVRNKKGYQFFTFCRRGSPIFNKYMG